MKSFLLLAALGVASANFSPIFAQNPVVSPQNALETDAAKVLTPDFVRTCFYIGNGTLKEQKQGEQIFATFDYEGYDRIKGADATRGRGLIAPVAAQSSFGKNVLVFARFDGQAKRGVIAAILPATPQNLKRVQEIVAQTPTLEFSIASAKPQLALGEAATVKLSVKNVSGATLSLYTGADAVQIDLGYGGSSRSSSDPGARKRPLFTTLKPGESWEYERTYKGEFPVGRVKIGFFYESDDAFKVRGAAPDDLYLDFQRGESAFEVVPLSAQQKTQLLARLKSPVWTQQLKSAQLILQTKDAAEIQKLEAFAAHPDLKLREIAAQALVSTGTFSPALKKLFYEGALTSWNPTAAGDFALAKLAANEIEREAAANGAKGPYGHIFGVELRDPRVGDLLAARLRERDLYGVELFFLSGLARTETLENTEKGVSAPFKAKILAAWDARRAKVENPFTEAQLKAEMDLARQIRYDNYQKGPFYDEVLAIVEDGQKLGFGASAEMDKINTRILALPKEAVPTLFQLFRWRKIESPPESALQLLADSDVPDKFVRLAQIAYGRNNGDARVKAIQLMAQLDFKRAQPHLEAFLARPAELSDWSLEAPRMGAALVLASRGEKRAVPVLFSAPYERSLTFLDDREVVAALKSATGLEFSRLSEWRAWWTREGAQKGVELSRMLGLFLAQALEKCAVAPEILETRPPFEPRHYVPIYGDWRVVRVRELSDGRTQLTVARELLREEKTVPIR